MDTKGEMIFSGDSRFFISVTEYNKEYDAIPGYVSVSYTHLDVYKRQLIRHTAPVLSVRRRIP